MINGAILKALRKSAGLSQSQLAQQLGAGGYSKGVVAAIENDRRRIGFKTVEDWAKACGYDVSIQFVKLNPIGEPLPESTLPPIEFDDSYE